MLWTNPFLLANGERQLEADFNYTADGYGTRQTYIGDVYDSGFLDNADGRDYELCTLPEDSDQYYLCSGTYADFGGCEGALQFEGYFDGPINGGGHYVIGGGTGDFEGATGLVFSSFDQATQTSVRTLTIN
jgi:hypothetical protein